MRFVALALAALALAGCSSPPLVGSGGAASGQETSGKTGTLEPQAAVVMPGAMGGVTQSKLGYQRQETGTQAAPALVFNFQPPAGATVAATYPALTNVSPVFIVMMGNSQREAALSADQIEKLRDVAEKAGAAATSIISASKASAVEKALGEVK